MGRPISLGKVWIPKRIREMMAIGAIIPQNLMLT
jgi:hypothetical protein